MGNRAERVEKTAALYGMAWFIMIIDACFTWFIPDLVRVIIGFLFMFFATSLLSKTGGLTFDKQRRLMFVSLFILTFFTMFIRFNLVYSFFKYTPMMCFIFWKESVLQKMYDYFKKFVVFYAILSIVVEFMVLSRLWLSFPYITIFPPQDFVQENLGYVNYFYGLFCIPAENTSLTFYRACGPLREGGHFIFFIGFVYFVEKVIYGKRNIWLILCGLLTLSPNFVILFLITEGYCAINQRRFLKPLLGIIGIVIGAFVLFLFSPQYVKDEIIRIIFERMLEASIENSESEGVMAFLDGRVGEEGLSIYQNFLHASLQTKLIGSMKFTESGDVMSDYRFMFMSYGYIGTMIIAWCTILFSIGKERNLYGACVLLFAVTVFVQRAWMFDQVYIWIMMLLAIYEKQRSYNRQMICQSR